MIQGESLTCKLAKKNIQHKSVRGKDYVFKRNGRLTKTTEIENPRIKIHVVV